jgi:DNA-binding CsgD family transcriptional regulator
MQQRGEALSADDPFRRLTPRHKQCLRLTYQRRVTKEIAAELNLGVGTVNTYCTEAIALLGARNRREAAEMLHAYEGAESTAISTPFKVELHSEGVATPPVRPAAPANEQAADWRSLLPFRRKGAPDNDLGILLRLAWIPLLTLAFAIGFGLLTIGLGVISDIIRHIVQ